LDPGLQAFRRVPSGDPLAAEAKFGAGRALSHLDHRDEAKAEFREAIRIDPGHTAAAAELARLESGERQ
jgi:Flp pilus assembly protein TadD